jgi:phage repressor protein C with HTH and peptisase S24 domain
MGIAFQPFFERLQRALGIRSQSELANLLQVNRSAITQAKRNGEVPKRWIWQLTEHLEISKEWLESGQGSIRQDSGGFATIPKVRARLCAGAGSFEDQNSVAGYYSFRRDWLRTMGSPEAMVLMDLMGDSMEPELKEGDTVLIDQNQQEILAGGIYALGVEDTIMVKRVEKHPKKLVLLSTNQRYSAVILQGEEIEAVRCIGRVLWVGRELV